MRNDILKLFDGLNESEVREFRLAIIPTLQKLRDEIIAKNKKEKRFKKELNRNKKVTHKNNA